MMPELNGKTLADFAKVRGVPPDTAQAPDLVLEIVRNGGTSAIWHVVDEGDVRRIMQHPRTMIASDGELSSRRERSLASARVRHLSPRARPLRAQAEDPFAGGRRPEDDRDAGRAAAAEGSRADRGGMAADLVVFYADRIIDRATFDDPDQYLEVIPHVLVNGVFAVDGEKATRARAGQVLRREPGRKRR